MCKKSTKIIIVRSIYRDDGTISPLYYCQEPSAAVWHKHTPTHTNTQEEDRVGQERNSAGFVLTLMLIPTPTPPASPILSPESPRLFITVLICIALLVSQHLLNKTCCFKNVLRDTVLCSLPILCNQHWNHGIPVTIYLIFYSNQQLFKVGIFLCIAVSVHEYFTLTQFLEQVS